MQKANRPSLTVLAHRGTSLLAPENTMPAFEFAERHGANCLELDVRLTRDGVLLVTHDADVKRTTNGSGLVAEQLADSLQLLDAAYRYEEQGGYPYRGKGIQIPRLTDVFSRFVSMKVNIDIKDNNPMAVDELARVITAAGVETRVVVASFHREVLDYCRQKYPHLTTSACSADVKKFLWYTLTRSPKLQEMPVRLFQLPRRYFVISFESRWFINAVHKVGGEIHFWTVNDASIMRNLIDKGADGIVTDRADVAAHVIAGKAQK